MADLLLNILTLGLKPLFEKQGRFDNLISDFRERFANPARAGMVHSDIEEFYANLDKFDFKFVFFKEYYLKYIENLNRFKPNKDNTDLAFLRIALAENKWKPTKPFPVFIHHLKYGFSVTSNPFISHQKKQNRKKIDAQQQVPKTGDKTDSTKTWKRVPLNRIKN